MSVPKETKRQTDRQTDRERERGKKKKKREREREREKEKERERDHEKTKQTLRTCIFITKQKRITHACVYVPHILRVYIVLVSTFVIM